jgi:hypothetical protein
MERRRDDTDRGQQEDSEEKPVFNITAVLKIEMYPQLNKHQTREEK